MHTVPGYGYGSENIFERLRLRLRFPKYFCAVTVTVPELFFRGYGYGYGYQDIFTRLRLRLRFQEFVFLRLL